MISLPNYDLGTAHGKIVITSDDRGAGNAERALYRLRAAAAALSDGMQRVRSALSNMRDRLMELRKSSEETESKLHALRNSVDGVHNSSANAANRIRAFAASLDHLGRRAMVVGSRIDGLSEAMSLLTASGAAMAIFRNLNGFTAQIAGLTGVRRRILDVAGSLGGLVTASRALRYVGTRFGPAIKAAVVATSAFGFLAPRLTSVANRARLLASTMAMVFPSLNTLGTKLGLASNGARNFARTVGKTVTPLNLLAQGAAKAVLGTVMIQRGLAGIGKATKIAALGLGALSLGVAAIGAIGTVALGAWDAVKQLSGALLILPGAVFSLGLAGAVGMVAFKGMKSAFEAMKLEGEDFDKAIKDMPPSLQDAARAGQGFKKQMKGLSNSINDTVWQGFGNTIRNIGEQYMPTLEIGTGLVARGLNRVVSGFADFVKQPATVQDLNGAFRMTGQMLENLSKGVWPFMAALRDIGMVGMEVMTDLSGGIGGAAARFGDFIAKARGNGDLKRWITDGIQGFKDLGTALAATGSLIGTFFRAFGGNGDNALERFAATMTRLRDSTKMSAETGGLKTFVETVERLGSTTIEALGFALEQIGSAARKAAPFMQNVSEAFNSTFMTGLKMAFGGLSLVATILGKISGLGSVVGILLGIGAAFTVMNLMAKPLTRLITVFAGIATVTRGAGQGVAALTAALRGAGVAATVAGVRMGAFGTAVALVGMRSAGVKAVQTAFVAAAAAATHFGAAGRVAAGSMAAFRTSAGLAMGALGGPMMIAIMAAIGALMVFGAANKDAGVWTELTAANAEKGAKSVKGFGDAFEKAAGQIGDNVFEEATQQVSKLRETLDETATKGSGAMSDIGAWFKDEFSLSGMGDWFGGDDTVALNRQRNSELDHMADNAAAASAALTQLGKSNEDLGRITTGTDEVWSDFVRTLGRQEGGSEALKELQVQRDAFIEVRDSMNRINASSPGSLEIGASLATLGDSASSATDKLNALKSALQALGLMTMSADEAFADYQQKLDDIGDSSSIAVNATEGIGDAMLKIGTTDQLDLTNQNSRDLQKTMLSLSDSFMTAALNGEDVNGLYADLVPRLASLGGAYGQSEKQMAAFAAQAGIVPEVIATLVQVIGAPEATQDMLNVAMAIQRTPEGKQIIMDVDNENAIAGLRSLGIQVQATGNTPGEVAITGNWAQAQQAVQLLQELTRRGANGQVNVSGNIPAIAQQMGLLGAGVQALPGNVSLQVATPGLPAAQTGIGGLLQGINDINGTVVQPPAIEAPVIPDPLPLILPAEPAPAIAQPVIPAPAPLPLNLLPPMAAPAVAQPVIPQPAPIVLPQIAAPSVQMPNIPQPPPMVITADPGPAMGAIGEVSGALAGGVGAWNEYAAGVAGAMSSAVGACQTAAASAIGALNGAAGGAFASGSSLGAGFAAGIQSQVGAVAAAAAALAAAASAPLPNSPAKIGPFSGTGWTPFRGAALAEGFAQGILSGTAGVQNASLDMVKAVAGAISTLQQQYNLPGQESASGQYIKGGKSEVELKAANDKRIAQRDADEARSKLKDEQKKAKDEAKKTDEERKKDAESASKERTPEQQAADDKKTAEQLQEEQLAKAIQLLEDGNGTQDQINEGIGTLAANADIADPATQQALRIAADQNSSTTDVLAALEQLDKGIASTSDIETQDTIKAIKDSAMSRKDITSNEIKPSDDIQGDTLKAIQNVFTLLDDFEKAMTDAGKLGELLVRGLSNTKDVTTAIDGFQGLASSIGGIISTVADVASTVASIGAIAGSVIPGLGTALATASAITGGIGTVNSVIDLVQQGFKIAGRIGGGFLSMLAGGKDGAIYGNIRTLLDTNDKTIKRWSDANPDDKRSNSYDFFNRGGGGNTTSNTGINNLNIYQGPGTDPYRMIDEAMFAVKAQSVGAYGA